MIDILFSKIYSILFKSSLRIKEKEYRRNFNIHPEATLNYIENIWFKGNIEVGRHTYINSGRFVSGPLSKIVIGEWCAIGHNVNIIGWTHDSEFSTGPIDKRPTIQQDVTIGNNVWIGTNVFIKEGVTVGNNAIIGANSVVVDNVIDNAIVGGIPARVIKLKVNNV